MVWLRTTASFDTNKTHSHSPRQSPSNVRDQEAEPWLSNSPQLTFIYKRGKKWNGAHQNQMPWHHTFHSYGPNIHPFKLAFKKIRRNSNQVEKNNLNKKNHHKLHARVKATCVLFRLNLCQNERHFQRQNAPHWPGNQQKTVTFFGHKKIGCYLCQVGLEKTSVWNKKIKNQKIEGLGGHYLILPRFFRGNYLPWSFLHM